MILVVAMKYEFENYIPYVRYSIIKIYIAINDKTTVKTIVLTERFLSRGSLVTSSAELFFRLLYVNILLLKLLVHESIFKIKV